MYKLLFFCVIAFLSSCSKSEPTQAKVISEPSSNGNIANEDIGAVEFWKLISLEKINESLTLANSLVKNNSGEVPGFYRNIFKQEKIKESILSREEFNELDAFFWLQARVFYQIAIDLKLKSSKSEIVKSIFDLVKLKIKKEGEGDDVSAYPIHIWQRAYGVCDRQAWVFCEIAYQLGANTSVIYLMDPDSKTSPHTICEIEFDGVHYVIDTLYDVFLPNTGLADLSDEAVKEAWADRPELHNTFKKAIRQIPSMPIDYSERNQRLYARLGQKIRFGEPPQNRYYFWKNKSPNIDTRFWSYPIRLLKKTKFYQDAEK